MAQRSIFCYLALELLYYSCSCRHGCSFLRQCSCWPTFVATQDPPLQLQTGSWPQLALIHQQDSGEACFETHIPSVKHHAAICLCCLPIGAENAILKVHYCSIAGLHPDLVDQYWCFEMNEGLDAEATGAWSAQKVWWEHLCVDGRMHRQQLRVNDVVRQFERYSRISCRTCAAKGISAHFAKHQGCLIDRD